MELSDKPRQLKMNHAFASFIFILTLVLVVCGSPGANAKCDDETQVLLPTGHDPSCQLNCADIKSGIIKPLQKPCEKRPQLNQCHCKDGFVLRDSNDLTTCVSVDECS